MKHPLLAMLIVLPGICLLSDRMAAASGGGRARQNIATPTGTPVRTHLNINSISTVVKNTGLLDIDDQEANSGLIYPKGTGKTAVFQSGFLWGARVSGQIRVGGTAYREGTQGGKILSPGVAEDPALAKNRIYRVRPDESPEFGIDADLSTEVVDEGRSAGEIRYRYETDWLEWPAADGAPFVDVDGDGIYDPHFDIPGVPGAAQTIWSVANDLDSNFTQYLYGSPPMGIEMQMTVWAYAESGVLGQSFFRRYLLINKSNETFDSMYVSPWSDPDVGASIDDFAGCDTALDLGYCYNAHDTDATYTPLPPPAVGFALLRGPLVQSPGDTGVFNGTRIPGHTNLRMTALYYFTRGDSVVTDPTQGSYEGTLQFYNFFQGRVGRTGELFINPDSHEPTPFALTGDPATVQGWVDGQLYPPGDRRIGLSAGPFTMAPGDSQEVVLAEILGGAAPGVDRLGAVNLVKSYTVQVREFFDSTFVITAVQDGPAAVPSRFAVFQNYPNPFNPVTQIRYTLPADDLVRLVVNDLSGREVAVLVDGRQARGDHLMTFDATGLPSGIYFYRMTAGTVSETRKMLLIR